MIPLSRWLADELFAGDDRPWLLLGKGPTFDRRAEVDLAAHRTFALNHVARHVDVDVFHAIDIDVVDDLGPRLLEAARWVVLPSRPHVANDPGPESLAEHVARRPVLQELEAAGRLVWYNASTAPPTGNEEVIRVQWFSAEAALRILVRAGARRVRTLGIDGGRSYSASFSKDTLLRNGLPSFDLQTAQLAAICDEHDLSLEPVFPPLKVFVGSDRSQLVAAKVLEASIRKNATVPVEVHHLCDEPVPVPKDPANRPRTGFSFSRFLIPERAGRVGRAVYLDADMLVFGDVAELEALPFDGATVLCTQQTTAPPGFSTGRQLSVMVLDCAALEWDVARIVDDLDAGRYDYDALMKDLCIVPSHQVAETVPEEWNHLERHEAGRTRLLHYTVMPTQPWVSTHNPLRHLWIEALHDAAASGGLDQQELLTAVKQGHVLPDLLGDLPEGPIPPLRLARLRHTGIGRRVEHVARRSGAFSLARWALPARRPAKRGFPLKRQGASDDRNRG